MLGSLEQRSKPEATHSNAKSFLLQSLSTIDGHGETKEVRSETCAYV